MASCLIFIEVLDNLKKLIAESLCLQRPQELFKRMKPNSTVYFQYYEQKGMTYIEI
jgi:hypothetical protein